MTNKTPLPEKSATTSKKVYYRPVLTLYGNIREITKNVGNKGKTDGATSGKTKSQ